MAHLASAYVLQDEGVLAGRVPAWFLPPIMNDPGVLSRDPSQTLITTPRPSGLGFHEVPVDGGPGDAEFPGYVLDRHVYRRGTFLQTCPWRV